MPDVGYLILEKNLATRAIIGPPIFINYSTGFQFLPESFLNVFKEWLGPKKKGASIDMQRQFFLTLKIISLHYSNWFVSIF
jgi:hypothetical protein